MGGRILNEMPIPAGYRLERGMLWPAEDRACAAVVFDTTSDLQHALKHVRNWHCAVQAGGNMGVWALALATHFEQVLTFEADRRNYRALSWNVAHEPSILAFPFALDMRTGEWCATELPPREVGNAGAIRISQGETTPTMALDSLNLFQCDLIYLDIEGYEMRALVGATETIKAHRPVVAFEDKGLSDHYGVKKGDAERYLASLGYVVASRPHRDVVMVPAP